MVHKIAFNSANLVGRITNYQFQLKHWGDQHRLTATTMNEREWAAICQEISAAGYTAVEIWEAHADSSFMTETIAQAWRQILADNGLEPIAFAGSLTQANARTCAWLGIPLIAGGGHPKNSDGSPALDEMRALCHEFGVRYAFENHPEKSAEAILAHIESSDEHLGIAVDTGWLGTQGLDAPAIIRELGVAVHHVHLKDVQAHGGHETVLLGEGVVNPAECIAACKEIGYSGWYSWEDEPEIRNPFESAVRNREWIERQLER